MKNINQRTVTAKKLGHTLTSIEGGVVDIINSLSFV